VTIYGRFHSEEFPNVLTVERVATLDDVKKLEGRRPDATDRKAVQLGSYVVMKAQDGSRAGKEELYHIAYLKADDGWKEISAAIDAAKARAPRWQRFQVDQVVKEGAQLGVVLQTGKATYDVIWVGGSTTRYRYGARDVHVATEFELKGQEGVVRHLRGEALEARRERRSGARVRRGQVSPRR